MGAKPPYPHATNTRQGDIEECKAIRATFADCPNTCVNNTKSLIGHAMGAAGVLELAGNLPAFTDHLAHPKLIFVKVFFLR